MATASFRPATDGDSLALIPIAKIGKWDQRRKRIKEMKSRNGVHPLDLFPKEIWMEIMNNVNPKDRWSLYQIHPVFSDLLESTKIRDVLFPQALAVMMNRSRDVHHYTLDFDRDDIIKSGLAPLIKLRGVCKSLRSAIDGWFEKEHLRMLPNYKSPDPEDISSDLRFVDNRERLTSITLEVCPNQVSNRKLKDLIENFRATDNDGNNSSCQPRARRFFLRSIQVEVSPQNFFWDPMLNFDFDFDQVNEDGIRAEDLLRRQAYKQTYVDFLSDLASLLELVGDQIWYFKLNLDPWVNFDPLLRFDVVTHYKMLRKMCMLMPNLRRLDISFYVDEHRIIQTNPQERIVLPQNLPFPKLQKLEKVIFEQECAFAPTLSIYNAILESNPQIKILRYTGLSAAFEGLSPEALKALQLHSFMFGSLCHKPPSFDFTAWKNILQTFNWPLKHLGFRAKSIQSAKQVFQFLENFSTLESVSMVLEDMEIGNESVRSNLPSLTDFEMDFFPKVEYAKYEDIVKFFLHQFHLSTKKKIEDFHFARLKTAGGFRLYTKTSFDT